MRMEGMIFLHELSLMQGVLELAEREAVRHNLKKITSLKLVVGEMTAALPEALRFAFESLRSGNLFEEANLEIVEEKLWVRCKDCGNEFRPELPWLLCPQCQKARVEFLRGRELYLDYLEGE